MQQKGITMKRVIIAALFLLSLTTIGLDRLHAEPVSGEADQIARGKYIVHDVAMCIQCHTPRNERGELIMSRLLRGAPLPVGSPYTKIPWAGRAPSIAGMMGYSDDEAVTFLTTGKTSRGDTPMPPMPPFRMNKEDAQAVIAYLKSIR